jgi:hypothetical protein
MSSLRYRNNKWQVQVRRYGHTPQAKSFLSKADAQRWARQIEIELDRTLIPTDPRLLSTITVTEVLTRYRDTVTVSIGADLRESRACSANWLASPWSDCVNSD